MSLGPEEKQDLQIVYPDLIGVSQSLHLYFPSFLLGLIMLEFIFEHLLVQ